MRGFLLKSVFCGAVAFLTFFGYFAVRIWMAQPMNEEVYELPDDVVDVFIGSSQFGCSIDVNTNYHNRLIWVSGCGPIYSLMHLRELERREQLKNVKRIMVSFNIVNFAHTMKEEIGKAYMRCLPMAWRYTREVPLSLFEILDVVGKYRWWGYCIGEKAPERPPAFTHGQAWIDAIPLAEGWHRSVFTPDMYVHHRNWCDDWENVLMGPYYQIREICEKHNIKLAVVLPPLPSFCKKSLPSVAVEMYERYGQKLSGDGFTVINTRDDIADELFADYWHLTREGAVVYTKRFYEILNSLH